MSRTPFDVLPKRCACGSPEEDAPSRAHAPTWRERIAVADLPRRDVDPLLMIGGQTGAGPDSLPQRWGHLRAEPGRDLPRRRWRSAAELGFETDHAEEPLKVRVFLERDKGRLREVRQVEPGSTVEEFVRPPGAAPTLVLDAEKPNGTVAQIWVGNRAGAGDAVLVGRARIVGPMTAAAYQQVEYTNPGGAPFEVAPGGDPLSKLTLVARSLTLAGQMGTKRISERFVVLIETSAGLLKVVIRRDDGAPMPDPFPLPDFSLTDQGGGGFPGLGGGF